MSVVFPVKNKSLAPVPVGQTVENKLHTSSLELTYGKIARAILSVFLWTIVYSDGEQGCPSF